MVKAFIGWKWFMLLSACGEVFGQSGQVFCDYGKAGDLIYKRSQKGKVILTAEDKGKSTRNLHCCLSWHKYPSVHCYCTSPDASRPQFLEKYFTVLSI